MKKAIIALFLAASFASCNRDLCGCYEPVSAHRETFYPSTSGIPMYVYVVVYRNRCGESKREEVSKAYYDVWRTMPEICD